MSTTYAIEGQTAAGTTLTILQLVSPGTTRRAWINYILIGSDATPDDVATEFNVIRGTVSGTGTAVTPRPLDPGETAAIFTAERGTFSGQTKTPSSAMLNIALNQRSTFQWYANRTGIVVPATSDSWVGIESIASGGTPNINATMHFDE